MAFLSIHEAECLEVPFDIHSHLEGIAALSEIFLLASGGIIDSEGVVMGVGEIPAPKTDEHASQVEVEVSA